MLKLPVKKLKEAKYSFDHVRNAWFCGRKPVTEEAVLIYLIQYAKSQNIHNAGEWAELALESAKSDPEITTGAHGSGPEPPILFPGSTTHNPAD